jgi:hypothetical protein
MSPPMPALKISPRQRSLFKDCPVTNAVQALSAAGAEERGAIFTRREVVEFILDLIDYRVDQPLHTRRVLEPAFGNGDFLIPIAERLLAAWTASKSRGDPMADLAPCLCAVELHADSFESTREKLIATLTEQGIRARGARGLSDAWLIHGDFLLADIPGPFDYAVGNPPYVRQELIPDVLMAEYRSRYDTIYDRADLYIPFIERSLTSLSAGGQLGFICADRWMKNRYGGPLRELVAEHFHLKIYVDMVMTDAFHTDVIAYPAITIIGREKSGPTRIAHRPNIDRATLSKLAADLLSPRLPAKKAGAVRELVGVAVGAEPWILESADQLALVRRLEAAFPILEDAGCKVGIGVATGADEIFIGPLDDLDVEPDRKLPLAMTRDILSGHVEWRGLGVINPFADGAGLVSLDDYPRLKRYLEGHKKAIADRHCAQKAPANWYRTIDRIYPVLARTPKLLIPDIKGQAHIVYEDGKLYPHHNLYYITSDTWDLKALQAVLLSGIARLFVATYSTKMRGGYLRFQAQYLRRIRLPHWEKVPASIKKELIDAAERSDIQACNRAVFTLYGLAEEERAALGGNGACP